MKLHRISVNSIKLQTRPYQNQFLKGDLEKYFLANLEEAWFGVIWQISQIFCSIFSANDIDAAAVVRFRAQAI